MTSPLDTLLVKQDEDLGPEFYNRRYRALHGRLAALEGANTDLEKAEDNLVQLALERIDTVLAPAYQKISELEDIGAGTFDMGDVQKALLTHQDSEVSVGLSLFIE